MEKFVCVDDFEESALKILPPMARDYFKSGAGEEKTLGWNREAFRKLRIRPRVLHNVSKRDISTEVFGERIEMPIGVSPTAMQRMAHPDGECASARACESMGTIFILSTIATSSIEEISIAAPTCIKWFQLYIYSDRNVTVDLIKRAEKCGFKALVLTVDTPFFGIRRADVKNQFVLPKHLKLANFDGHLSTKINKTTQGSGLNEYVNHLFDDSLTWNDIDWLKSVTKLPIILKGILTREDAILACDKRIDGILVSNHGARQIDGTPASIEALPEVVKAVDGRLDVFLDGGVRQGTDVFKALALGAKMVFCGRPIIWGLAHGGEEGAKAVLKIIRNDFDQSLALAGCKSISDIEQNMVLHELHYSKL